MMVLVTLIGILSVCTLSGCNDKAEQTNFTVFSDIHIVSSEQYGDTMTASLYEKVRKNEKVFGLTEALFRTAIDNFIASDSPVLIITGDLTDDGAKVAHQEVARQLARAEQAGKKCFVINGNHDINNYSKSYKKEISESIDNVSPEEFAEIYADFGYNEALERDENTLSYTAELNEKYRLIAVDTAHYTLEEDGSLEGRHLPDVTDELLDWLYFQLLQCRSDGKEPFLITHFPVLSHVGDLAGQFTYINRREEFLQVLEDYDVSFGFCGHVHQQDIATYTHEDYTFYEVETGSLTFTTLPVRTFTDDGKEVRITTESIPSVNPDYIPAFYSQEERQEIVSNLQQYVLEYENTAFGTHYYEKVDWDEILAMLGAEGTEDANQLFLDLSKAASDFFYMPLYSGQKNLKSICSEYGIDIPVVDDCDTVCSVVVYFVKKNFGGDEKLEEGDDHLALLKYAVYTAVRTLSDFRLTERIHACNEDISAYDISGDLEKLYTEGKLEVCKNDLLGIIGEIPVIAKIGFIEKLKIELSDATNNASTIKALLDGIVDGGLLEILELPAVTQYTDVLLADGYGDYLDYSEFEEDDKVYIHLSNIIDAFIENFTDGLLNDEGAPDNNFAFVLQKYEE